jgi:hypothetical protein
MPLDILVLGILDIGSHFTVWTAILPVSAFHITGMIGMGLGAQLLVEMGVL